MYKLDIETNAILDRASLGAVDKKRVPEGALFFEGIVSDGNKNRNGYIIDSNAWFFDKNKSVKDFLKT
jgi:type I restriction-modification system DNA methylase subunit